MTIPRSQTEDNLGSQPQMKTSRRQPQRIIPREQSSRQPPEDNQKTPRRTTPKGQTPEDNPRG